MSKIFDWLKLLLDWVKVLKDYKWLLLFSTAGSVYGNMLQYFEVEAKTEQVKMTQAQVTAVASHLGKIPEKKFRQSCDCQKSIEGHVRRYH